MHRGLVRLQKSTRRQPTTGSYSACRFASTLHPPKKRGKERARVAKIITPCRGVRSPRKARSVRAPATGRGHILKYPVGLATAHPHHSGWAWRRSWDCPPPHRRRPGRRLPPERSAPSFGKLRLFGHVARAERVQLVTALCRLFDDASLGLLK